MSTNEQAQATIDTLDRIRWEIQNTLMMDSPAWWLDSTLYVIEEQVLAMNPTSVAQAIEMTTELIAITE